MLYKNVMHHTWSLPHLGCHWKIGYNDDILILTMNSGLSISNICHRICSQDLYVPIHLKEIKQIHYYETCCFNFLQELSTDSSDLPLQQWGLSLAYLRKPQHCILLLFRRIAKAGTRHGFVWHMIITNSSVKLYSFQSSKN